MDHSRIMALFVAGGLVCGGFSAFGAEAKPAPAKPVEEKPAEVKPAPAKPVEEKPAEVKPAPAKPVEEKPAPAKPVEEIPAEVKPAPAKPTPAKPAPAEAKPAEDPFSAIPPVLAEIGGQKITKDMVVERLVGNLPNGQLPPEISADLIKRMLPVLAKEIVIQKIFESELAKAGINPSAEMVKAKLNEEIKKMEKMQLAALTQQVQMEGKTLEQYIDGLANDPAFQQQMAGQIYLEDKVLKDVKVDTTIAPDAAQKFYNENKDEFKEEADKPDQIRASHILIAIEGTGAEAEQKAKKKAEQIIKILKEKPADFESIAKDNSSCPSSQMGGDLGVFSKGQMAPEFEAAALALKDGEITSEPVKTQYGYHIIRRNALKTEAGVIPFEKVKPKIERYLQMQKAMEEQQAQQKAFMEYFNKLEKEYNVKYHIEIPADMGM